MHTSRYGEVVIQHNGSRTGEAVLVLPADYVEIVDGVARVHLDASVLQAFVADGVRAARIAALEQATPEEILGNWR